ncbi:flagellar protein FlgN, partial [Bordetella avium]|uniref:flagella synthesis protein FlgN n=1 Tax=Bordetella avium TaxID=521 RepID=UPI00307F5360
MSDAAAALRTCIETETALILQFISALQAESEALLDRKAVQSLKEAAERKEALADQLVAASQERDQVLAGLGLEAGHAGTQTAVEQFPELADSWQTLQNHASQAREANQHNAVLLEVNLRYTTQTIEALRPPGRPPTNAAPRRGPPRGGGARPP